MASLTHSDKFLAEVKSALAEPQKGSIESDFANQPLKQENFVDLVYSLEVNEGDSQYVSHVKGQLLKFSAHLVAVTHQNFQGLSNIWARKKILVGALKFMSFSGHYKIPDPLNADVCTLLAQMSDLFSNSGDSTPLKVIMKAVPFPDGVVSPKVAKQVERINLLGRLGHIANEDEFRAIAEAQQAEFKADTGGFSKSEKVEAAKYIMAMIQDVNADRSSEDSTNPATIRQYFAGDSLKFISNLKCKLFDLDKAAWASAFQRVTKIKIEGAEKPVSGAKYAELLGLVDPEECSKSEIFKFNLGLILAENIKVNSFKTKESCVDDIAKVLERAKNKQEFMMVIGNLAMLDDDLVEDKVKLYSLLKELYEALRMIKSFSALNNSVTDLDSLKGFLNAPESESRIDVETDPEIDREASVASAVSGAGVVIDWDAGPVSSVAEFIGSASGVCDLPLRGDTPASVGGYSSSEAKSQINDNDMSLSAVHSSSVDFVDVLGILNVGFSLKQAEVAEAAEAAEAAAIDKLAKIKVSFFENTDDLSERESQISSHIFKGYQHQIIVNGKQYNVSAGDKAVWEVMQKTLDRATAEDKLTCVEALGQIKEILEPKMNRNHNCAFSFRSANWGRSAETTQRYEGILAGLELDSGSSPE